MNRWKVASAPFAPRPDYPGVQPSSSSGAATHAIWQDPSSYNPYTEGPPYLPNLPVVAQIQARTASEEAVTDLPGLLVGLRALALLHQSHHWLTQGESFYAQHLLFERLYNNVVVEIDRVGERAVGLGAPIESMLPHTQAQQVARLVANFASAKPEAFLLSSLNAERWLLTAVDSVKKATTPSTGTDNLLGDIGDTHEEHVYLLNQQSRTSSTDPWKAG